MVEVWVVEWRKAERRALPRNYPNAPTPFQLPWLLPLPRLLPTVHLAVRRPATPCHIIKILGCDAYKSLPTSLAMRGKLKAQRPSRSHPPFPSSGNPQINGEEPGGSSASHRHSEVGAASLRVLVWECDASSLVSIPVLCCRWICSGDRELTT